ncbi:GAP family protein [Hazenella coriacea]|uniref:Sap-like sulfolipid-1-addressing protein n=1 Tax=Hazenella coriacea TaxID=1179467 RepID=A0A4R3LET2_9BACL|nr:GAP family protein [Hazenella coriacea]TCS95966.1 Sap-like sulfolipid-1-addressing protein [Hazenella coriacea]
MTTELLISIGALSILDTLSPTTIGVTVYMLLSASERSTRRLLIYLLTVSVFYFIVGILLMLGMDKVFQAITHFGNNNQLMTFAGLGLLIGSFFVPTKSTSEPRKPKNKSILAMIILGLTTGIIEVGTALPYFAAIGIMTSNQLPMMESVTILAGYNFIMVLPSIILIILHHTFQKRMQAPLEKLRKKIVENSGSTLSWLMSIAGILLLINA